MANGWQSLGGGFTTGPAAVAWAPGRLDVFRRGLDVFARGDGGRLMQRTFTGSWAPWEQVHPLPVEVIWDPGATSWGTGRIDLCFQDAIGQLLHKAFEGGD